MQQRHVKLVLIDNLGLIKGAADENSAEMIQVMGNLRWLAEQTGAAVIAIQPPTKGEWIARAYRRVPAWPSSIEASLDLALLVEREPRSQELTIRSTKTRDVDVPPFGARFTFEHRPNTDKLATARFHGTAMKNDISDSVLKGTIGEVVKAEHPINQSNLKKEVKKRLPKVGANRIGEMANNMASGGDLKSTTGARKAVLYDVPGLMADSTLG